MVRSPVFLLTGCWVACASGPVRTPIPPAPQNAPSSYAEGIEDVRLAELVTSYWEYELAQHPEFATRLGDHRFDDRLTDVSWAAAEQRFDTYETYLESVRSIPSSELSGSDRVTQQMLIQVLTGQVGVRVCRFPLWALSPRSNPITDLNYLPEATELKTPEAVKNLLKRYKAGAIQVDNTIQNLKRGASEGWYPNRESARRVLAMVNKQLEQPVRAWPMWLQRPPELSESAWPSMESEMETIIEELVKPALVRYRDFLEQRILPSARTQDVGLTGLPFGKDCYAARIRNYTTLPKTAQELHETGKAEIERINREMVELGTNLFGMDSLDAILSKLRQDPSLRFDNETQVLAKAQSALERARSVLPAWFGRLPEAKCLVREIPDYEAPFTTVAYYRQPVPGGGRPGEYYVNTYQPETRTRYEAEALAYHESIPGHHLQIAIQQELSGVPDFRKHAGMTAFVEGWALYAEQLALEMGLYSGDLDRLGQLSYEAWRAARLVVDTGIHAYGWSRNQAKAYMGAHTALAANNIDNEVDRYIVWPGQALAYKTGQMEILRMRRQAEQALGAEFSIEAFHDAVLLGGAVSLPILRQQVDAYIEGSGSGAGGSEAAVPP